MKLLAHFAAESANFNQDGTFTVYKGGITDINSSAFPTGARIAIITRLEFTPEETSRLHQIQLNVVLPGGQFMEGQRNPIAVKTATNPSVPRFYANVIAQLVFIVPQVGEILISGNIDDENLPLLYLTAVRVAVVG